MPFFRVVAERSLGIFRGPTRLSGRAIFGPIDIFDPGLSMRVERRVWDRMECASEKEVRDFFAQAQAERFDGLDTFRIVSIEVAQ